ncbi:MAG: hypothetical protein MR981_08105 [Ruminococcus bromii]|jgi:stage III sporulation protein AD|uniref:SpoIIIAC/SpoIIIAD family protein n=1 Tax=Ruminococcus sp. YE282 TaxID=3158780 RepID=UPI000887F25F|nr:hypothetical protein [Ruminococcus bromii]MCI7212152.1 hypothetical protein [Ruminococcus bromii]MDD6433192.1 SpoIIIAC/SpoIIIAD family protein [Ruminococcus bromii]MDY4085125.1 SpoIIIAC/SpoIIIAD family protein [Ruminococcus bromii]MDY4710553.1 SpoIIIAC/SpoIIIAD family protein [Ruminococcus bromii]
MNVITICVLAVTTVIFVVTLRPKNGEIALMLGIACSVMMLLSVLSQASAIFSTISNIIAVSDISTSYVVILLKVIGICLVTEFAVNTCNDAGSKALASNVSLAGKILVTVTSLPLYADILNVVLSLLKR